MLFCFALATASVKAEAWDLAEDEEFYGEPRLLDSLFNNTGQISMNAILALVLVGVLFLVTSGGSFLGGGSGYNRNSYAGYGDYDYQNYYQDNQFYNRAGHTDGEFIFLSSKGWVIKKVDK